MKTSAKLIFALASLLFTLPAVAQTAQPTAASTLLSPNDHALILIDHQPQMAFATNSIDIVTLRNNVTGLAKSARAFDVPTILTTVAEESFAGPLFPELQAVFPDKEPIDRTTMNTWEDERITNVVNEFGRKKLVIAALWTEVCGVGPVLSALEQGFEVYFVTDASGGVSVEAHDMAVQRMVQAGARPITWLQYLLELQRDWARQGTYVNVTGIAKEHGGGYGLGIIYAKEMFDAEEGG
ncbi:MAG: hydrolase [Xanthomonadales bacterium]|nr:hydrolase [Xanthomonadales bacterium]